ncbi:MAG: hypothetical protein MUE74_13420, partial [Bacteroidales bacterium]|nr:hypothetical protein [Bacteroidales bacterium]
SLMLDTVPVQNLRLTLEENDIKLREKDSTLRQIAERNATTPAKVYNILAARYKKPEVNVQAGSGTGQGFGRYTLETIAKNSGKDVSELIALLQEKGVDAKPETTLRSVAEMLGLTPKDTYSFLISE